MHLKCFLCIFTAIPINKLMESCLPLTCSCYSAHAMDSTWHHWFPQLKCRRTGFPPHLAMSGHSVYSVHPAYSVPWSKEKTNLRMQMVYSTDSERGLKGFVVWQPKITELFSKFSNFTFKTWPTVHGMQPLLSQFSFAPEK